MDPDFEINRRQYLAEQESKKGKNGGSGASRTTATKSEPESSRAAAGRSFPDANESFPAASAPAPVKAPDHDLIDFFDSIEQNQHPAVSQPDFNNGAPQFQTPQQFQQTGFVPQQTGFQDPNQYAQQQQPFGTGFAQQPPQLQPNFTGAGFGSYTPQQSFQPGGLSSIPQDAPATFQQQQSQQMPNQQLAPMQTGQVTNPFRQSMMMAAQTGMPGPQYPASPVASPITRQSTNPFAKSASPATSQPFSPPPDQQFQQQQQLQQHQMDLGGQSQVAPLRPMATGTNPFAKNLALNAAAARPQTSGGLMPQPTGSTNPFRQSQFVNTNTGVGWQHSQGAIGGGLDNVESVPVFPRPVQQQAWQQ